MKHLPLLTVLGWEEPGCRASKDAVRLYHTTLPPPTSKHKGSSPCLNASSGTIIRHRIGETDQSSVSEKRIFFLNYTFSTLIIPG